MTGGSTRQVRHRAASVDRHPQVRGGPGQPQRVVQRMKHTAPAVDDAAVIGLGSGHLSHLVPVKTIHAPAMGLPVGGEIVKTLKRLGRMRRP